MKTKMLSGFRSALLSATVMLGATIAAGSSAMAGDTLKVAYSQDYFMSSPKLAKKWFGEMKTQFEAANPGATLEPIPIPGSFDDFNTKLSLLMNSPATAPDVIQIAAQSAGQWSGSGLLAPLDDELKSRDWWQSYPEPIKQEGTIDGKVYAVSEGVNTFGLLYDRENFAKAGLPKDWSPKSWKDILDAARAIKKSAPSVWPIWLMTGTAQGSEGTLMGAGLLISASSDPTIFDEKTKKWVVDSKGMREMLSFYRDAAAEGLLAPASQILDANAPNNGAQHMPKHELGIGFAGNYWPTMWNKTICTPCWDDPDNSIALAPLPTSLGQAPGFAASFGGWSLSVNSKASNMKLAWSLIDIMQKKANMVELDQYGGLVPPVPAYAEDPGYVAFAKKPFQVEYSKLIANAHSMPASTEYSVWSFAVAQATETLVLKPETPIDDVVKTMREYVVNQLGDDRVEP
ncbi:extracellular solute-binding protein [Mesorhizobium sp. M2E.F.Ca.ET.209.01.1.1]|uniref:ABC transporter substrate-binding protein n=1 Tax=Mesorhizobium sp. M2E.F.Ca.ET.209.01.1.1 TaxID=2500526 RepID=UPI001FEE1E89|nr:extracellular solute-binding protein [Mesorhizobium sp. M2E.F.Ca.ET.209.01.1.1]